MFKLLFAFTSGACAMALVSFLKQDQSVMAAISSAMAVAYIALAIYQESTK